MSRANWFDIQVNLTHGHCGELDPTPGRIFMVGPTHSFKAFAEAIDSSFGRWDFEPDHWFLTPAEEIVCDSESPMANEPRWLDINTTKVAYELMPDCRFRYFHGEGQSWEHDCLVGREKIDPRVHVESGPLPRRPWAIDGWGRLPDQYGKLSEIDPGDSREAFGGGRLVVPEQWQESGEPSMVPDEDFELARRFCGRRIPEHLRDEIQIECRQAANTITIVELRPPWRPELPGSAWTEMPVARFSYSPESRSWRLFCHMSDGRWYEYEPRPTSPEFAVLLAEVDTDPTAIFWG